MPGPAWRRLLYSAQRPTWAASSTGWAANRSFLRPASKGVPDTVVSITSPRPGVLVVRFRHWRIYGEHGLARRSAAVWLYGRRCFWSVWYAAHRHVSSGGPCEQPASLRQIRDWPLHEVASISTLLGSAHSVLVSSRDDPAGGFTTMVLYVEDGKCYRPYGLLGGP